MIISIEARWQRAFHASSALCKWHAIFQSPIFHHGLYLPKAIAKSVF